MAFGTISKFNHDTGCGFIRSKNHDADDGVLVHVTELAKAGINVFSKIELKRRISYDILVDSNNQQRAINIRMLSDEIKI
jgi:cold shock CspA family protein